MAESGYRELQTCTDFLAYFSAGGNGGGTVFFTGRVDFK
jgi:hypothetical protein